MQGLPSTSHIDRLSNLLNSYLSFQKGNGAPNSCRSSGLALIRWSLEELSTREPGNALLLMEQILMKLQEMEGSDSDNTFVVLTLLFWFALVHMPHIHGNNDVLQRAYCHFRKFLSLPNPMGYVCRDILSLIKAERRAPGVTYQRIARMENMNQDDCLRNKTILLLDPADLSPGMEQAVSDGVITSSPPQEILIGQAFQSIFGMQFNVPRLREKLKDLSKEQLKSIYERCIDAMEQAAATPHRGKSLVKLKQQYHEIAAEVLNSFEQERASNAELENVPDFIPHFEVRIWKEDHLDFLNTHLLKSDAQETDLTCTKGTSLFPVAHHHGPPNTGSSQYRVPPYDAALLHEQLPGTEAENADQILPKQLLVVGDQEHVAALNRHSPRLNRKAAVRRRPVCNLRTLLRSQSESYGDNALALPHSCCCEQTCMHLHGLHPHPGPQQLHVVLFGVDRTLGRLAGAYCKFRALQAQNQKMTRQWHLQFYYIPVQSDTKDNFCEIGKYLSTLDPWYEGIISRFDSLVSAQSKTQQSWPQPQQPQQQTQQQQGASTPQLWANTLLYYCRNARCPIKLQLHQVTMTSLDEERQKIFIQEMELVFNQDDLGASGNLHPEGAGNPVHLDTTYHQVSISGRLQHHHNIKQCTALKLSRTLSDNTAEPGGEWLYLTLTEIIKLASGKPRVITTKIRVQEIDFKSSSTFSVCLDKDRENIISNITRCVVSPYRLPHVGSGNMWSTDSAPLCIAINTFSGSLV